MSPVLCCRCGRDLPEWRDDYAMCAESGFSLPCSGHDGETTQPPTAADRFGHEWDYDGPSWIAGSGVCRHCRQSDESEGRDAECTVRLRAEVERLRKEIETTAIRSRGDVR